MSQFVHPSFRSTSHYVKHFQNGVDFIGLEIELKSLDSKTSTILQRIKLIDQTITHGIPRKLPRPAQYMVLLCLLHRSMFSYIYINKK